MLHIGWFMSKRNLSLTVLEARNARSGCHHGQVLLRVPFFFADYYPLLYSHILTSLWSRKRRSKCSHDSYKVTNPIHEDAILLTSVQFSSVAQPTLCDPMDWSMPGFPVHHQLLELAQTHVHRVSDAIQPSHPLSSPSPPAFSLSQCQGLFQWVSSSHQAAKVLEFQLQHQSFQWTPRTDFL